MSSKMKRNIGFACISYGVNEVNKFAAGNMLESDNKDAQLWKHGQVDNKGQ